MIKCEICNEREATVHLAQVIGTKAKKMHLCEQCAEKQGIETTGPLSISDILLGMGVPKQAADAAAVAVESSKPERSCPRCHMTRSDFKKGGRFGCAECYAAFADELPALLMQMHRHDHHEGKFPAGVGRRVRDAGDLPGLQTALDKAVGGQKFEDAAKLRDAIDRIKAEQKPGGGAS